MEMIILALLAGAAGALIGGTQTFIITGFVGIISYVLQACGVDVTFFDNYVLNMFFLPCIIFNGACVATAYSAFYHDIRGFQTNKSLAFTNDIKVLFMGSLGGLLGYAIYAIANHLKLPMDTGALSVLTIGLLLRFFLNKEQKYNPTKLKHHQSMPINEWMFQLVMGIVISFAMAYFAYHSKLYTIGFSISALSLIFGLSDSAFPATHHTTLVAGYAVMQTGNIAMGIIFGVISHMINYFFSEICNVECGTHVDGPAVAIAICSLVLFMFF